MIKTIFQAISLSAFLFSCTPKTPSAKAPEVNLAIWGNYLSPEVQKSFTEKTGIKINITNYSSNEELLAKIQMGSSGIDMAVPSDYMVDIMTKLDLLEPLEKSALPNFQNILPEMLNQHYDPQNKFSVPYSWTSTGIAINRDLYKGEIKGWKDVLNNPALAGKYSLLDDLREVIGLALKIDGKSVNTKDAKNLATAEDLLRKIKKDIKLFTSDTIEVLTNKEVVIAQSYSVDALQAAAKGTGNIEYIIPEEGSTRSVDNLVVFKGAKNKTQAHALINHLLETENSVSFAKHVRAGPVLRGVREGLPADLKNNTALYPNKKIMAKLEGIIDLGEANRLYESIWSKLKTQ